MFVEILQKRKKGVGGGVVVAMLVVARTHALAACHD
jgi:hypothetical protein